MGMQRREFIVAGAGIVGATSIGSVAFTTANVSRDVSVDIVADDAGPIAFAAGATNAVTLTNGLLTIDTNTANANGLNGNGTFNYGDNSAPSTTFAFSMTNNGGGSRDFTFGLGNFTLGGSSAITLSLYDGTDTLIGDVTTSTDQTTTLTAGSTLYAVITFDTSGLTKTDNMNGDLTVDAVTTP
jgi:hypothetical protein